MTTKSSFLLGAQKGFNLTSNKQSPLEIWICLSLIFWLNIYLFFSDNQRIAGDGNSADPLRGLWTYVRSSQLLFNYLFILWLLSFLESEVKGVIMAHTRAGHPDLQSNPSPSTGCSGALGYKTSALPSPQSGEPAARWQTEPSGKAATGFAEHKGQNQISPSFNPASTSFKNKHFFFFVYLLLRYFLLSNNYSLPKWLVARWRGYWLRCA